MSTYRKRRIIFGLLCLVIAIICCTPAFIQMYTGMEQKPIYLSSIDLNNCQESSNQYRLNEDDYSIVSMYYEEDESIIFEGLAEEHYYYFDILINGKDGKEYVVSVKTDKFTLEDSDHIPFRIDGYIFELSEDIGVNRSIKDYPDGVQVLDLCIDEGEYYISHINKILLYVGIFCIILFQISMIRTARRRHRRY